MKMKPIWHKEYGLLYQWMPSHQRRSWRIAGKRVWPSERINAWSTRHWFEHDRKPSILKYRIKGSIWNA